MAEKIDRRVYVVYIRTTPAKLWRAVTSGTVTPYYYFRSTVKIALKKGGDLKYVMPDGKTVIVGKVLESKPGKKLVHTFKTIGWNANEPASRVTYDITKQGATCCLTLTHDRLGRSPGTARDVNGGWPVILSGLKTWLETGKKLFR
ncbi:MAG: hypothetical protein FD180_2665 [Planctomycetota bacterium]|nr:MAG: hypothetical protein FD180_2665 [Planctomycetota bacterium]